MTQYHKILLSFFYRFQYDLMSEGRQHAYINTLFFQVQPRIFPLQSDMCTFIDLIRSTSLLLILSQGFKQITTLL